MPSFELNVQSQFIGFSEWLSLSTQALAPLIAHLFVGVVEPTTLSLESISWHKRICQYNPTSIIWRYFAVTDRRFHAKNWTRYFFAATAAVFWDGTRLDGSERTLIRMRAFATSLPASSHISFLSKPAFHTLIVIIQGVQAVYMIFLHAEGKEAVPGHPVSEVFFPLAVLGLFRLSAAPWLTEGEDLNPHELSGEMHDLLPQGQAPPADDDKLFYRQWSWQGVVVRLTFLGCLLLLASSIVKSMVTNWGPTKEATLSSLLAGVYYLFIIVMTILCFLICILRGEGNTTVIPCIDSSFYLLYTIILILFSIVYVVITALEMRRTACGLYTTIPIRWGQDDAMCRSRRFEGDEGVFEIQIHSNARL
jgi:hypothetical protein